MAFDEGATMLDALIARHELSPVDDSLATVCFGG